VICQRCQKVLPLEDIALDTLPPYCACGGVFKPAGVFFGEPIPEHAMYRSQEAAQSCDLTSRDARTVPLACDEMFSGSVADGAPCAIDEECASSRCNVSSCPDGSCCTGVCGTTRPRGQVGDACDRNAECLDGYCDAEHQCHALLAANQECLTDPQCDYGLACIQPSPSIPGTCRVLPQLGEACPYARCAGFGVRCDATSHCVALGLVGAPCASPDDCSPYERCDATTRTCTELPTLGMPCDTRCAGEAWCKLESESMGTCMAPQPNGTPCEDSGECVSQNCKPGALFESCSEYPVCF